MESMGKLMVRCYGSWYGTELCWFVCNHIHCTSKIYWTPRDAPQFSTAPKDHQQRESLAVRRYVDDECTCRMYNYAAPV